LALPERFEICKAGWLDSRGLFAPPLALPHLGGTFSCPKVSGGAFRRRSMVFSDIFDSSQQRRTCALELHFSPFFHPDQGRIIFVVDRQLNVSRDVYLQIEKNVSRDLSLAFHCF